MRLFVAITDYDWFQLHAARTRVEEVNFWRPSSDASFKALQIGEVLLFKLHAPRNFIVGGGFFARFLSLPLSLAWSAFGENNGAQSLPEMRERIARYRRTPMTVGDNPTIGCILLAEPFFFPEREWIPAPPDFSLNIVQGKGYETKDENGKALWDAVRDRLAAFGGVGNSSSPATQAAVEGPRYGAPTLVCPRLGQGIFRVVVTEAYERKCAITGERTLPVLEAAHIRPFSTGGSHDPNNGLLLRSDLHVLFDQGYLTVSADDFRVVVSSRIREEFENGRDYYELHGRTIRLPREGASRPSLEHLKFHNEMFR